MSKQIVSKAIGIDLGTTNSVVAVMNPTDTDIIIHRDAIAKRETTPSCVWKDPKTGEIVVGHKAFRRVGTSPSPIRAIKRLMGTQTKVLLTDEEVTPEQVSAWVLGEMKRQIEEDVARFSTDSTKWIVDRAIITVPAYFDMAQIDATRKAGEMAGLQVLDLLHEPTAAACYHCFRNGTQNGVFLVYHFGGGTFDVTVLRYTAGVFEVLGISGNNRLGGDDIDAALAENIQERLLREGYALELDVKNDPEDRLRFDKLKFLAEGVKKALSTSGEFLLRDTGTLQDKEGNPAIIEEIFERSEVEEIIKPIVERTIPYCFEALERTEERAGVKLADIDAIILAGGSTHIPLVREMVRQNLCADPTSMELVVDERANQPRAKCVKPVYEKVDTIVALGTAIRAAAVGGLAIYNPERTVRVSFREAGATGQRETHIGGKVESLDQSLNLTGGRVRLIIEEMDFKDELELSEGGTFSFRQVPLRPSAENLLTFEVYDRTGTLVATAGRPISQSRAPTVAPMQLFSALHRRDTIMDYARHLIGQLIGDYRIIEILGKGGFATVFLAEHQKTKQKVAIKMANPCVPDYFGYRVLSVPYQHDAIPIGWPTDGQPRRLKMSPWQINCLLEKESEALEKITHPSFVKVLSKGAYYGLFYIVLEYIEGKTLRQIMENQETIPLYHFIGIIDALMAAEKEGLKHHGDIKPENIMVSYSGLIKFLDPSSPSLDIPNHPVQITAPLYNPFFVWDDIDSLGVLLYEISTGFLPFRYSLLDFGALDVSARVQEMLSNFVSPSQLNPELPEEFSDIIMKALHLKAEGDMFIRVRESGQPWNMKDEGYQSLSELKRDLEEFIAGGKTFIKIPRPNKTEAILRAISPYLVEGSNRSRIKKTLNFVIDYQPAVTFTYASVIWDSKSIG